MSISYQADSASPRVWSVAALCRAVADSLQARFNPVRVQGEISGFSRAASGHCYFSIKDEGGQLRCAMFRRAAEQLDFVPRDGDRVQLQGQLGVYEQRGDLQLIVERLQRDGQGTWMEQFLRLKAHLQAQGLFDAQRKRPLPAMPRGLGLVTSLGAAALHDVATALQRRAPHIPVVLAPALVQGEGAPRSLMAALEQLYALAQQRGSAVQEGAPVIDAILLVRGGGAPEDLWAFNDEALAHTIVASPVPIVSGVGHETDVTLVDFAADLRAPTPTAAAEMVARDLGDARAQLDALAQHLSRRVRQRLDGQAQRLDQLAFRMARPSQRLGQQGQRLHVLDHRMLAALQRRVQEAGQTLPGLQSRMSRAAGIQLTQAQARVESRGERLEALSPQRVLERGYAWLADEAGHAITSVGQAQANQAVSAVLADGVLHLRVTDADAPVETESAISPAH